MVQSLPRFMEAQAKLSTHTSIAAQINSTLTRRNLSDVEVREEIAREEQLKATSALQNREVASEMEPTDKLELLLLYAATHPEKFDDAERAVDEGDGFDREDMDTVTNLEHWRSGVEEEILGGSTRRRRNRGGGAPARQRGPQGSYPRFTTSRAIDAGLEPDGVPQFRGESRRLQRWARAGR